MKNKTNQIVITYILASIFLAILYRKFFLFVLPSNPSSFGLFNNILFILFSGILLKYILYKNNIRNTEIYRKLKKINNEIKESNEKYDIVSKATSDTIWDWKITDDTMTWNKGIEAVFGYKQTELCSVNFI